MQVTTVGRKRPLFVRRLAHDAPSYSGVGASGKPGAVQDHKRRNLQFVLTPPLDQEGVSYVLCSKAARAQLR